ncbi:MAG: alkyl hydroperoxide reductase [Zetaproteobacteria bacterium CG12_big_fil_rev_8_21_14_0_65_55_1124]|nr:MAG: alkyl hydroperoxide reductase [Zetaproteobacteria bacterium CG1_02_55_237]PIS19137.1 MAG: alkyl hydroperoxide reductase [Zetaproteobacteria bacterium CG08_land_8_20_14_0_20_55_17]PIW43833.1 MAG: alkyl hydroperoxide reductase [Zetaproteobacteria bacterium CG12_big_fil_rev_8_21_14_0_65_55_1124]PIY52978.1 MAG: alkyl hydroperoxide reductase [Zetaproteobacteria bacterium CG_4_10_14_0_8_um_filter_55_43]PIZ37612.1 MAG: alkyl hydroperoxide reductase [Zetaproteobacteria bacterium CG_4_10_14_0_2_
MSLREEIEKLNQQFMGMVSAEVAETMGAAAAELKQSGIDQRALKVGDRAPDFNLPELAGGKLSLTGLLADGSVVISFYRGAWCPYCNLEMQALQAALPAIEAAGGRLIAIAPETAAYAGEIRDKGNLTFPLLQDKDNAVSRRYGLVFTLPETLRPIYEAFGIDLADSQDNDAFELPMPATYIVGTDGIIAHAFVDADYTKRMEPADIVEALQGFSS